MFTVNCGRAVEKISRSVERIDENEALGPGHVFDHHIAFLADDRHARKGLGEPRANDRLGPNVGVGHGRAVRFVGRVQAILAPCQDFVPRGNRRFDEDFIDAAQSIPHAFQALLLLVYQQQPDSDGLSRPISFFASGF